MDRGPKIQVMAAITAISYLIYLLIGIAGLPIFSSFSSGFAKLLGPTGGYLIGFIPMAIICGFAFEKFSNRGMQIAGLAIGTIVAYIFGTAWLAIEAHLTFYQALLSGVIPYIPGDLVKIILVVLVGPIVKKRKQFKVVKKTFIYKKDRKNHID